MAYPPPIKYPAFNTIKVVTVGVHPYGYDFDAKRDLTFNKFIGKYDNDLGLPYRGSRRNWSFNAWRSRGVCMVANQKYHTTEALSKLSHLHNEIVFIVCGRQKYRIPWIIETGHIRTLKPFDHLILTDNDSNIFSKANEFLKSKGKEPINWRLEG